MITCSMDNSTQKSNPSDVIRIYMSNNKLTYDLFTKMCKISTATLARIISSNIANANTAQKIEDGTNCGIKFEDLTDADRPDYYIARLRTRKTRELRQLTKNILG